MVSFASIDTIGSTTIVSDNSDCICTICFITSHTDDTTTVETAKNETLKTDPVKIDSTKLGSVMNDTKVQFVYSPTCPHVFCLPCISRVLLVPGYYQRTKKGSTTSGRVITMTHGECPVCRKELSYFDLNKIMMDGKNPDGTVVFTKSNIPVVEKVSPPTLPPQLRGAIFTTKAKSYVQFPLLASSIGGTSPSPTCVTLVISTNESKCKLPYMDDGCIKVTGWKYLEMTQTFQGRVKTLDQKDPDVTTEATVWMTFSDDFQFITHGVCRVTLTKRVYTEIPGESYPQLQTKVQSFVHPFGVTEQSRLCRPTAHPKKYAPKVPYDGHSFWGNSYFQNGKLGLVSYHFERKPNKEKIAYVSFNHPMSGTLSPLDNGRPVPSRVMFRNIVCPDAYTFRASICWYDDYNTTWNGIKQWDYEIRFDSMWMCIKSGSVRTIALKNNAVEHISFYGKDLIYINAAAYDIFIDTHVANEVLHPSLEHELGMSLMTTLGYMVARLNADHVTEPTTAEFVRVTFLGSNRFMSNFFGKPVKATFSDEKYPIDNVQYYHF